MEICSRLGFSACGRFLKLATGFSTVCYTCTTTTPLGVTDNWEDRFAWEKVESRCTRFVVSFRSVVCSKCNKHWAIILG